MVREWKSEEFGFSFEHPSHWKLSNEQFQPGVFAFLTGEQVEIMLLCIPLEKDSDEELNLLTRDQPQTDVTPISVSSGDDQVIATSAMVKNPATGPNPIRAITFRVKKMAYMFQISKSTPRFEKELESVLSSAKFTKPEFKAPPMPIHSLLCKTYFSAEDSFRIHYPEDWTIKTEFSGEQNLSCRRLVKFNYIEENFSLSFTVTKQKLPMSITTVEFCTMIQNHICKSGHKYSESATKVLSQHTKRFNIQKANGVKYSYVPVAFEGVGYLFSMKVDSCEYLEPHAVFSAMLLSFKQTNRAPQQEMKHFYNFKPKFYLCIPKGFKILNLGVTQFVSEEFVGASVTVMAMLRKDLPPGADNLLQVLAYQWHQQQMKIEFSPVVRTHLGERGVNETNIRGELNPGSTLPEQAKIIFYETNEYALCFIWQAPSSIYDAFWNSVGSFIKDSFEG